MCWWVRIEAHLHSASSLVEETGRKPWNPGQQLPATILAWSGGLPLDLTPIRGKGCFCFDLVDSDLGGY